MFLRRALALVLFAPAVLVALADCTPKEGDSCSSVKASCLSSTEALFCIGSDIHAGKYERVECLGTNGCKSSMGKVTCDTSHTTVGTACPENLNAKAACDEAGKEMLTCNFRKWELQAKCGGPKGCSLDGTSVSCDQAVAAPGDGCTHEGRMSCTSDGHTRLMCRDQRMVEADSCGGPKGCHLEGTTIECDGLAELLGAPCKPEGSAGCAVDGKTHLTCMSGKNENPVTCHGTNGCAHVDGGIYCDRSVAAAGEPCLTPGAQACSVDGATLLGCTNGAYLPVRACSKGCSIKGTTGLNESYRLECP